ncbi:hypothetical protein TI03_06435, partial [Achromatium sp. WMS1]
MAEPFFLGGLDGKCLTVKGNTSKNGTAIVLSTCTGENNQKWSYMIGNMIVGLGGKCLTVSAGEDGTPVILWPCDRRGGIAGQKWTPTKTGEVRGLGNKCLDVY